jgi:hypothetical protein
VDEEFSFLETIKLSLSAIIIIPVPYLTISKYARPSDVYMESLTRQVEMVNRAHRESGIKT